jgi:hypothetical protein
VVETLAVPGGSINDDVQVGFVSIGMIFLVFMHKYQPTMIGYKKQYAEKVKVKHPRLPSIKHVDSPLDFQYQYEFCQT